jgi:hypothetical protein
MDESASMEIDSSTMTNWPVEFDLEGVLKIDEAELKPRPELLNQPRN